MQTARSRPRTTYQTRHIAEQALAYNRHYGDMDMSHYHVVPWTNPDTLAQYYVIQHKETGHYWGFTET